MGPKYLYNVNEAKMNVNGTVTVKVHGLGAVQFEELLSEYFECRVDSGFNDGAVRFITFDY